MPTTIRVRRLPITKAPGGHAVEELDVGQLKADEPVGPLVLGRWMEP